MLKYLSLAQWIKNQIQSGKLLPGAKLYSESQLCEIRLLREAINTMDGHDFEYFCADLLRKNGFDKVEVTKGSGDQGIDIIAFKDGIKYGIQCKMLR